MFGFWKKSKIDDKDLDAVENVLDMIIKLNEEDKGNFICFNIFGLNNTDDVVSFAYATQVFFKVLYSGSSVVTVWRKYQDFELFAKYKNLFQMFEEENGGYSFCTKVRVYNSDIVALLNLMLSKRGYSPKAEKSKKSLYFSML